MSDLETTFQLALAVYDDRPAVKQALNEFYASSLRLLNKLLREDAKSQDGRERHDH